MTRFLFLCLTLLSAPALALTLHYVGETSIPHETKFKNTVIGGLSGIVWSQGTLYALSDDKGKISESRFYEFGLQINKNKVTLTPKEVRFITGLPKKEDKAPVLDPEGLVRLPDGTFIISSEGNTDSKPREMPRIFQVSATGAWIKDFILPDKFLPESTGQQLQGVQNNASFEGLTTADNGEVLFAGLERALLQDSMVNEGDEGDWVRVLKFTGTPFKASAEYVYSIDTYQTEQVAKEVFRGVSEMLAVSANKVLVLERGVKISPSNMWIHSVALYEADLSKAQDVSSVKKLTKPAVTPVSKKKILDLEKDLVKERPGKSIQNFEALAWGPVLPDGRKTLLMMSDNNFSKKEITELLVFAVEGE